MKNFKKLIFSSFAILVIVLSASICASAQIESLSVVDGDIYASVAGENSRLYVAEINEGLLIDAFFADSTADGNIEIVDKVKADSEYRLFLWDKDSLAPIFMAYTLKDGRAYVENSTEPVPEYEFSDYTFDQEDDVMIVSSISQTEITGFKAGVETAYQLTDSVTVLGLSDTIEDVVPGSVVLIGTNKIGNCAAIELLASVGIPVDPATFESSFGSYSPSDGSEKYQNFVTEMFSKNGTVLKFYQFNEDGSKSTISYQFESNVVCYRVGIAMDGETPVISYTSGGPLSGIFSSTVDYRQLLYLRLNTETGKIAQCVIYRFSKNYDWTQGDDEYTGIFSLKPTVIID